MAKYLQMDSQPCLSNYIHWALYETKTHCKQFVLLVKVLWSYLTLKCLHVQMGQKIWIVMSIIHTPHPLIHLGYLTKRSSSTLKCEL